MTDDEAFAFYSDPNNQRPGKRAAKRSGPRLTGHVPVRFPEETISRVRALADHDGLTVSSWIRQVVNREVERRLPSRSVGSAVEIAWTVAGETPAVRTQGILPELAGATKV